MHLGKSFLRRAAFVLAGSFLFCQAAPAAAGHDPLPFAAGVWQGEADNGHEKFTVSVTLKKAGKAIFGTCSANSRAGTRFKADFEANPQATGRDVLIKVRTTSFKSLNFHVFANPVSGTRLAISSLMGDGKVNFLNDFIKAEFELRSVVTSVSATMYRTYPPASKKKTGGTLGGGKKAPSMPPMVIGHK